MAGDSRIAVPAQAFDASLLVQLALKPWAKSLETDVPPVQAQVALKAEVPKRTAKPKKSTPASVPKTNLSQPSERVRKPTPSMVSDEIEIPTLMGKGLSARKRTRSNPTLSA